MPDKLITNVISFRLDSLPLEILDEAAERLDRKRNNLAKLAYERGIKEIVKNIEKMEAPLK